MSDKKSVQVFRPTFRVEECLAEIRECLETGWTGLGFKTVEFEKAWADFTGLPHAHFLSSATAGLHLALRILGQEHGWKEGDEVITTPLTFVSTNHAILYERLSPVFADVDEHLCLDPESVERIITPRTRAVMFVGLGGNTGRLPEIVELCKRRNLRLVLDGAHMAGTRLHGRHVGGEADASVFSFQAVKNLPTADSGMICFAESALDAEARKWSWLGINKDTYARTVIQGSYKWRYDVEHVGFKYHGNSIMAALGLVGLRYLDRDNAWRRQMSEWYTARLGMHEQVGLVPVASGCESSRHLFQILVDGRDETMMALAEHGIHPGVHYLDNTEYVMYEAGRGTCPRAAAASARTVSLPLHLGLTQSQIQSIADTVATVLDKRDACRRSKATKQPIDPLEVGECRIRMLTKADLEQTRAWRNSESIRCCFRNTDTITAEEHESWFKGYIAKGNDYQFVIEHRGDAVGQIGLYHIDPKQGSAEIGRLMIGAEQARGQGVAKTAINMLLSIAARQFGLSVVRLEVREDNDRALRLYKRCGFVESARADGFVAMAVNLPGQGREVAA